MKRHAQKYPVSVGAVIFNRRHELLLFSDPKAGLWKCVSGWVENETLIEAVQREIREEAGKIMFRVNGVIDAHTFNYLGESIVSVWYLVHYLGGTVVPSDDLARYDYAWYDEAGLKTISVSVPAQAEILQRAFRLMRNRISDENGSRNDP